MSLPMILLLLLAGAFVIPALGGDDDDEPSEDELNEIRGTFGDDEIEVQKALMIFGAFVAMTLSTAAAGKISSTPVWVMIPSMAVMTVM